jgi:hypothetical protein
LPALPLTFLFRDVKSLPMIQFTKFIVILVLFQSFPVWADVADESLNPGLTAEVVGGAEEAELGTLPGEESASIARSIRIKEIREYLKNADQTKTCMDEMIKLRGRMILKLALKPIEGTAEVVGGLYAGAFIGAWVARPEIGWNAMAEVFLGAALGAGGAIIYTGLDTTLTSVNLHRLNLILKALGEQAMGRPGAKTDALYEFYSVRSSTVPISKENFVSRLMEADRNGALCDGSMIRHRVFRRGLRARVAGAKEFASSITP